jgi:hypothetical protein
MRDDKKNTEQLDKVVAIRGTFLVNNTTEYTKKIAGILVLEDTTFTYIKVDGVDVKANYIAATGTAVKAGAYITGIGVNFSGVKLASGSVNLVLA